MFLHRDSTIKQPEHCKTSTVLASHTKSLANTGLPIIIDNGCGYIRSVSISIRKGAVHLVEETPQQTGMCHYYPARPSTANSHGLPLHEQVSCNPNRRSRVCVCARTCVSVHQQCYLRAWNLEPVMGSFVPQMAENVFTADLYYTRQFNWFWTNLTEEGTNYWFRLLMKPYILFLLSSKWLTTLSLGSADTSCATNYLIVPCSRTQWWLQLKRGTEKSPNSHLLPQLGTKENVKRPFVLFRELGFDQWWQSTRSVVM